MAKRSRPGDTPAADAAPKFVVNPFADLSRAGLPTGPAPDPATEAASSQPVTPADLVRHVTVRVSLEKKGRAGKVVTVLACEGLDEAATTLLVRELRTRLGVGGTASGDAIELQGDQRRAAADWLRSHSARVKGA